MSYIGDPERITQNRIVQLFKNQLGYEYYGDWTDRANNSNIETHYLKRYWATSPYTTEQQNEAIYQLQQAANNASKSLYERNKAVYTLLRNGAKVKTSIAEKTQTIHFIDWKNRQNNDFAIAEEVTVKFENTKRPDIVLYVNGIALGVIELKKSTVSVSEGIIQNLDNQKKKFIEPFFSTMQFVMAGNDSEGLRYGTIETPAKFYLSWKEESHQDSEPLDQHILQMVDKTRFLELVHDFVIFDGGIKKTSRPHQYFGVKAAQERIKAREGGVIWHTQGSGKSLTMVWLTNWILENITDPRVLIITDRDELDKQIRDVFEGVQQKIHRSKSGKDLIEVLNKSEELLICSLVHKFGLKKKDSTKIKSKIQTDEEYNAYITDLLSNLPKDFKAKGDVFVFVDECHRTQSGLLNKAMKKVLPDSVFIGFTGTPLLKQDKQTSYENFGTPIHTYKFNEAVKDGVVLDLRYEARNVEQYIGSQEKIDKWFDAKTKELKENAKAELKKRWGTMQKVLSSKERLEQIANDIILDFETKDRLSNGRGNAILVAGRIYEACKYYEIFQQKGFKKCAIVTSYVPNKNDLKGETVSEEEETQKIEQYEIYQEMLKGKDPETFENEVKETFTKSPAQMKLLIVVDKLLTGFDAPACTYLYIDKSMQDHGLFQAICRVNRLEDEDKEYGYIVDYQDLFQSIEQSVKDYTTDAFENLDEQDVKGLLSDRLAKGKEDLENTLADLKTLCEPVDVEKDQRAYSHYFVGSDPESEQQRKRRLELYKLVAKLIRQYTNLANQMTETGYSETEARNIKKEVTDFENLRANIKLNSGDYINLKMYEPAMRHLIDTYINAKDSEKITSFEDMTLVQLILERGEDALDSLPDDLRNSKEAVAETIENNVRKVIINEETSNPVFFAKMSELLQELVTLRKRKSIDYAEHLKRVIALAKQASQADGNMEYPEGINTRGKQAIYDNVESDATLTQKLNDAIHASKKHGWFGNPIKELQVLNAIKRHLIDAEKSKEILEIIKKHAEYTQD